MGEYIKDFDGWNSVKKKLDENDQNRSFHAKEIWQCSVGVNVGSEHDGKGSIFIRPVYILKVINKRTFIGIPLTSKLKEDYAHLSFYFNYDFTTAILSQIKVFDQRRLIELTGTTSNYLFEKMKKAVIAFIIS